MSDYIITIPSLGRHTIINEQTLKTLEHHNISSSCITIFVIEEEYEKYRNVVDEKYKIVIGVKGIVEQRQFIENYYPYGTQILFLDDDIKEIDLQLINKNLHDFIIEAFQDCLNSKAFIWSVYPVFNLFFRKSKEYRSDGLNFIIGAFFGIINRPNDEELKLKITPKFGGEKEDIEKSILYFKKDGKVIRYNQVGFNTKYYSSVGGLGTMKERIPKAINAVEELYKTYPKYGKIKIRKNGIHEFTLNKIKAFFPDKEITEGQEVDKNIFSKLIEMLDKLKFTKRIKNNNRSNFPVHESAIFGIIRHRYKGTVGLSAYSLKYKEIYHELHEVAKQINPNFHFNAIHVNKNLVCPKHIDGHNVGKSLLISIGDYSGCNIVINDKKYDAKYKPIYFNGALLEHYNTDDLEGTKYSIIYYHNNLNAV